VRLAPDEVAEAMLIEISRWQREALETTKGPGAEAPGQVGPAHWGKPDRQEEDAPRRRANQATRGRAQPVPPPSKDEEREPLS